MKNYYLYNGKEQSGPFSIEELEQSGITSETPVCTPEMSDWTKAEDIPALQHLLQKAPPPFKGSIPAPALTMTATEKTGFRIGRFLGWTGLVIVLIAGTGFMIYKNQHSSSDDTSSSSLLEAIAPREKTPEELRAELAEKERANPATYLVPTVKVRYNFVGQTIVEGSIMNNASVAIFKDIVFEVSYISKTNSVISTEKFTVYEVARPGKWASFKFRTSSPKEAEGYSSAVISATPISD